MGRKIGEIDELGKWIKERLESMERKEDTYMQQEKEKEPSVYIKKRSEYNERSNYSKRGNSFARVSEYSEDRLSSKEMSKLKK